MSKSDLATPELAAVEVEGMTRSAFMVRGALAAGAAYGAGAVAPFVGKAFAQGGGDVEIANFALTLEFLEAAFYTQAVKQVKGMSRDVKELAEQLESDETEHVDALTALIKKSGGKPVAQPKVDFGDAFSSESSFLKLAGTFEETGVGAYNGAAPKIKSKEVLNAAGSIVQIEGRHVALINLKRGASITPEGAFSTPLRQGEVLKAVKPFVKS
ncbi:MAG: ferritin-like domain-containing protein [Actinomycetota bacterium]|nr:ferritin-like domain-containing protein [Actinomycetota bacterium]